MNKVSEIHSTRDFFFVNEEKNNRFYEREKKRMEKRKI